MSKPDPARYRTTNWKSYSEPLMRHWFEHNGERAEAARVATDLARQGHGVAGAQGGSHGATAGVLRCSDPVLMGWTPPPDGIAMCHGGDVEIATEERCPWTRLP